MPSYVRCRNFRFCVKDLYTWAFNKFSANFFLPCAFIKSFSTCSTPPTPIRPFHIPSVFRSAKKDISFWLPLPLPRERGISNLWQDKAVMPSADYPGQDFNHINPPKSVDGVQQHPPNIQTRFTFICTSVMDGGTWAGFGGLQGFVFGSQSQLCIRTRFRSQCTQ